MALKLLKKKSLLAIVENSVKGGDNYLFRNLYVKNDQGEEIDIIKDGENACGLVVSWPLLTLGLIKTGHATVEGTVKDMLQSGWYEIKELKPGAVLLWEKAVGKHDGLLHGHIGFYIGNDEAISNSSNNSGFPVKHHYEYNGTRKVVKIYWHPELDEG